MTDEIEHLKDKISNLRSDMEKIEESIREEYREAWREYKQHINQEIDEIQQEIDKLQCEFGNNQERIIRLESALENIRKQIDTMEGNILSHVQQNGAAVNGLTDEIKELSERLSGVEIESELKDEHLEQRLQDDGVSFPDWQSNPYVWVILILVGLVLAMGGYNLGQFI